MRYKLSAEISPKPLPDLAGYSSKDHMPLRNEKKQLLGRLERAATQAQSVDAQLMKKLEKCPSAKIACALLVSALSTSRSAKDRDELLTADPGWIHPFV